MKFIKAYLVIYCTETMFIFPDLKQLVDAVCSLMLTCYYSVSFSISAVQLSKVMLHEAHLLFSIS